MAISESCDPVIVSVDWLALSIRMLQPYEEWRQFRLPSDWQLLEMSATATWLKRWYIMDGDGNKLATFLTLPRSPKIKADRAMLEIANQVLYSDMFERVVDSVLMMFPMEVDGINRIDLCGDFEMSPAKWEVVRGIEVGENYLKGLRRGVVWWEGKGKEKRPHQLSWGGAESVFKWKLYNKYKELHEGGSPLASKPYIEDMWKEYGMRPSRVWRLEISIAGVNRIEVDGSEPPGWREWWERRVEFYRRLYSEKFVVRQNEGHKDKRHDPILKFLDLGDDGEKFVRHRPSQREMESDEERRVVCKVWKEYTEPEVQTNRVLFDALREFLVTMCQYPRNIRAISVRYNLTPSAVISAIADAQ